MDTNRPLLDSALRAMRQADPNPPVVVMDGDFLAHNFESRLAVPTMQYLARRFNAAFPHAQFVIALGNEDSACRDYGEAPGTSFLTATARAWAPLVNRNGAAPGFMRGFAHDGFYTARLPVAGLQAVVINDIVWSPLFRPCGAADAVGASMLRQLRTALRARPTERHWVIAHIPPGIDAYSTSYLAHHLAVVPFLEPGPRGSWIALLADPASHVVLSVNAHIHKFAYRIVEAQRPIPILLAPAISPIFSNNPAFLTATVAPDGVLTNVDDHAFVNGRWEMIGGLATLGVERLTGDALEGLQRRLARDAHLRARFASLYESGAPPEITSANWRTYWCAATAFSATAFRGCDGEGGFSVLRPRGLTLLLATALLLLALTAVPIVIFARRRRRRTPTI